MEKNPYLILGVAENASEEDIRTAHARLRKVYSEQLFLEGDAGMHASRKLSELDIALADALEILRRNQNMEQFGGEFGAVENAIKTGNLDGAQRMLDNMTSRRAEWHYLQSVLFYKRGWLVESKKQLEMALNADPENEKYKGAHERMKQSMHDGGANQQNSDYSTNNFGNNAYGDNRGGYPPPNAQPSVADTCCGTCACLCCADSCCDCCGSGC